MRIQGASASSSIMSSERSLYWDIDVISHRTKQESCVEMLGSIPQELLAGQYQGLAGHMERLQECLDIAPSHEMLLYSCWPCLLHCCSADKAHCGGKKGSSAAARTACRQSAVQQKTRNLKTKRWGILRC